MVAAETLLKIVATWLLVDLISGVVHWCEDSYGHPDVPLLGRRITRPNLLHHVRPRAFVTNSWYTSSQLLLIACGAALVVAWLIGRLSPMVVVAAAFGVNANQVHKWSHQTPAENGSLVTWLQRVRLIQSPEEHRLHHVAGKDSNYCVLTNVLNPLLDGAHAWRGLEWILARAFGLKKRDDDALLAELLAREPDFLERAAAR